MTQPRPSANPVGDASDPFLAELLEQLTTLLQDGQEGDVEAFLQAHPDHAVILRTLLPSLQALADVGLSSQQAEPPPGHLGPGSLLGDYRIARQVGRGGMGVVYEAVQ
ncbi:MAG TPA: hypothetical protein VKD72_23820, partial [Gemmataceae bacterium]|nr:hypothetical protein [Gemmataceae bacterium]